MPYSEIDPEKMVLRDHLALDRTKLANERTSLSYARTALMLLISAISLIKLFEENQILSVCGYLLLPAAVVVFVFGIVRFCQTNRKIESAMELPRPARAGTK